MIGLIKNYLIPANIIEHVVDNYIFDKVLPIEGSIVYCDFICSASIIQHSGIYVGNGEIIHLNRKGHVEKVTPEGFVAGLAGFKCGSSIYVSCNETDPVGCVFTAEAARFEVGNKYDYSVIKYNCHQFVSECLGGGVLGPDFMNPEDRIKSTLTGLKIGCRLLIDSNNWRVWDR